MAEKMKQWDDMANADPGFLTMGHTAIKNIFVSILVVLFLAAFIGGSRAGDTGQDTEVVPGLPVKNTVTLVDLGATTCIPCKMMAPILEELKKEYAGQAEVIFIDVRDKTNEGKARAFEVLAIPTQIFYDREGREVFRHIGFFDKQSIIAKLEEILAQP